MATCKRCKGVKRIHEFVVSRGEVEKVTTACPDCKGTGEVEDDDGREGDNTNKGDGDDDA